MYAYTNGLHHALYATGYVLGVATVAAGIFAVDVLLLWATTPLRARAARLVVTRAEYKRTQTSGRVQSATRQAPR